ncbi:RES family NAD+ phosphorylase [Gelidibacter pelagius]|uniref:RES family NAD+ phosphorylase n=1 Tax=Gelidibacter pelagius TaxID=2819985 RepID=A0ABS3SWY8_9FLAO|nr:RES family NAD+ phosphorylase [Gelidibacter pelagius]MBO3099801.1 RES family NAD+ phosphorylase [Gelidibacter pelagius]
MRVFRLSKKKYSKELNGKGASKSGSRWNSKGTEIIDSAESRALAMAEVAVHLTIATLPSDYVMIEIDIPDDIQIKELEELPDHWNSHPPNISTQKIGDEFIDSIAICVLKVPSAVVQGDHNYLINPYHKQFNKIKIIDVKDFPFDKRIFN